MDITATKTKTYFKIIDGFFGGIIGGIGMGIFAMMLALLTGKGLMQPLMLIGYTFQPYSDTPEMNAGIIFTGLLIHIGMSMVAGVVFIFFANTFVTQKKFLWLWGAFYASLIWLIIQFGLLKALNPIMENQINQIVFLLAHIVFGVVLGGYVSQKTDYDGVDKI